MDSTDFPFDSGGFEYTAWKIFIFMRMICGILTGKHMYESYQFNNVDVLLKKGIQKINSKFQNNIREKIHATKITKNITKKYEISIANC